ncbi:tripartite tricarboxylate transporter TctB family protein [Paracoccus laeviglucosivorans]|uniref:Tripartite tricarboxylate transporter TctB family protein n=1 Tax=Paracoccus laeviglucosivorans TaxID=1197861 RepID=A0A521FTU5_9RHOB|nr:tripartite tricarboxylate transporter TctB family protein [Paracoccus laeviglucosivorans]SMO99583.1 Tripartite tricarboxylate transporter TctB family protein [Paracoccus laeviglucosivorans]
MSSFMRKDALAGIFLMAVALFFGVAGRDLAIGRIAEMGPGFIPLTLAAVMFAIGAVMTLTAVRAANAPALTIPAGAVRVLPLIFLAVLAFVLLLQLLGYVLACAAMVTIASLASPQARRREVAISAVVLSVLSALAFVTLLGLPMPLWPEALL